MKFFIALVLIVGLGLVSGCHFDVNINGSGIGVKGSGVTKTETRSLDEEFSSIELAGVGNLEITQGENAEVTITADDNLLELLSTEVINGRLVIKPKESISTSNGMKFKVVTKELQQVTIDGAGSAKLVDIESEELALEANGSSSFSGTGNVSILNLEITGAGSAKLQELKSGSVKVEISGAGSATVHATKSIEAEINGVGSLTVHGNPEKKQKEVNGLGTVSYVD